MKKKTGGKHLTLEGRKYIEKMYKSTRKETIAEHLGVHLATINRELGRCEPGKYSAMEAQRDYETKLHESRRLSRYPYGSRKAGRPGLQTEKKQIRTYIRLDPGITVSTVIPVTDMEPELIEHVTKI